MGRASLPAAKMGLDIPPEFGYVILAASGSFFLTCGKCPKLVGKEKNWESNILKCGQTNILSLIATNGPIKILWKLFHLFWQWNCLEVYVILWLHQPLVGCF